MIVALAFAVPAVADESSAWNVHTELRVVVLPQKQALALLPELRDVGKAEAAWAKIDALIAVEKGKSLFLFTGEGESGKKIESREVEEVVYSKEFDRPSIVEQTASGKSVDVPEKERAYSAAVLRTEVRKIGFETEMTPLVTADGRNLVVDVRTSHVRLLGWTEIEQAQLPDGSKMKIKQPKFAVSDAVNRLGVQSGARVLLGIHGVPGTSGELELSLFRVWTTPRKP